MRLTEILHQLALLPLLTLVVLRLTGRVRDVAWWWLAGAFFVSWLADTGAHWLDPWLTSRTYPVSQSAIVALVLIERREAARFLLLLTAAAVVETLWINTNGPAILLPTVAWLPLAFIAFNRWDLGLLRWALVIAFGIAWLGWMAFALLAYTRWGWWTWGAFQASWHVGMLLFSVAAVRTKTVLRLLPS